MNAPLENQVAPLLLQHKLTLAVAESCTGGLIGHRLTNVPGSSAYFLGGVIAYAYEVKQHVLEVPYEILSTHGSVSGPCARAMAQGVRQALHADIGLSVTGIAGPGGGTPDKPVGLVWLALAAPRFEKAVYFVWDQDREGNKALSAEAALQLLLDYLQGRLQP